MANLAICSVDGCSNSIHAKDFCAAHYRRITRHGHIGSTPVKQHPKCSVVGCADSSSSRGMCSAHYSMWRLRGSTERMKAAKRDILEFIEKAVSFEGEECLQWPFSRDHEGYGKSRHKGSFIKANRLICILAHGEPPTEEHQSAHTCGKGHLGCVNPKHLRWSTPIENAGDREKHGTIPFGQRHKNAKLTDEDAKEIYRLFGTVPTREIASAFGVSCTTVSFIGNGVYWSRVTQAPK